MFDKAFSRAQGFDMSPNKGARRLPIVYIRNNTEESIENIHFSFDDVNLIGSEVKKVKTNTTKNVSLYLTYRQKDQLKTENYDLIMHHMDKNKYLVCEGYGACHINSILVEIMKVYNDGTLGIRIDEKYSNV